MAAASVSRNDKSTGFPFAQINGTIVINGTQLRCNKGRLNYCRVSRVIISYRFIYYAIVAPVAGPLLNRPIIRYGNYYRGRCVVRSTVKFNRRYVGALCQSEKPDNIFSALLKANAFLTNRGFTSFVPDENAVENGTSVVTKRLREDARKYPGNQLGQYCS